MSLHRGIKFQCVPRGTAWQYIVHLAGKRVRQQYPTEREAREECEKAIDRALDGLTPLAPNPKDFSSPTLRRVFELVYTSQWKGTKGEQTAKKNGEDCIKFLGEEQPIDRVKTEDVDRMIADFKAREMKPGTIRRKLAALSTIFKYANTRHWKVNAIIDRKSAGKESKRLRFLSPEEEADLLKFLNEYASDEPGLGKVMADFFTLLIDTGLRLSEAVNLKWSELDGVKSIRLGFDNKGEQPRMVPLTARLAEIIGKRREARQQGEKLVWPGMTSDRADYFWQLARKALKQEEDEGFVIHCCRHTFASRLAQNGVGMHVIKELGGWKTLEMVLRYAHLMPKQKEEAILLMQRTGTNG